MLALFLALFPSIQPSVLVLNDTSLSDVPVHISHRPQLYLVGILLGGAFAYTLCKR